MEDYFEDGDDGTDVQELYDETEEEEKRPTLADTDEMDAALDEAYPDDDTDLDRAFDSYRDDGHEERLQIGDFDED